MSVRWICGFFPASRKWRSGEALGLDVAEVRITVLPMTTLTFKVAEEEARSLRAAARRANLTLSEFLRRQLHPRKLAPKPVKRVKCRQTGAKIFAPASGYPALTPESVKEMLADFP